MMTATVESLPADPEFDAAVLMPWRSAGRSLVANHWADLRELIESIRPLIARGRYAEAAAAAQIAASYALIWHAGIFASPTLERILLDLGQAALPAQGAIGLRRGDGRRLSVLHVATQVYPIGGHTRMLWRWIGHDTGNMHSVALTRQTDPIPHPLSAAVAATGGRVRYINRRVSGLLGWARSLQAYFAEADLVVLHTHNQDVIPFLAMAGMRRRPPVILLNHADHIFWLGVDFVDLVVNTRRSGHDLCATRRGVEANRNVLLPLCLDPVTRQTSRRAAKCALGLPDDSIVLLTVARSVKFRPVGGVSFADALLPLLRDDKRLRLVAVGPGGTADWSAAETEVPGQILAFAERLDTAAFFDAADIYVDSFPFSSNTSLLEAGLHGLPLVTRFPFGGGCEIMGADSLGLDSVIVRASNVAEFRHEVNRLVADRELRAETGARTKASIDATNTGEGWSRALAAVGEQAFRIPQRVARPASSETPCFLDVDLFWQSAFGWTPRSSAARIAIAREMSLKTLPPTRRLQMWACMAWRQEFAFRPPLAIWRYLVPEWITVRARAVLRQEQERVDMMKYTTVDDDVEPMHVAFCASHRYFQHLTTAAVSLAESSNYPHIKIHVVTSDSDHAIESRLKHTLCNYGHVSIAVYHIPESWFPGQCSHEYITKDAYMRWLIADVVSPSVNRVIYLDSDVIVLDDIRELWEINLSGSMVGAAPDFGWCSPEDRRLTLGIPSDHTYVNSGVLVIDLDRWRRDHVTKRLFKYAADHNYEFMYFDQDPLNAVLHDDIYSIDVRWNFQALWYTQWARETYPAEYHRNKSARDRPGIIHYTTTNKPWKFRSLTRRKAEYFYFLNKTSWRYEIPTDVPLQRCEYIVAKHLIRVGIDLYILIPIFRRLHGFVGRLTERLLASETRERPMVNR